MTIETENIDSEIDTCYDVDECDEILEHDYTGTEVITANPNPVFDPDSTND